LRSLKLSRRSHLIAAPTTRPLRLRWSRRAYGHRRSAYRISQARWRPSTFRRRCAAAA